MEPSHTSRARFLWAERLEDRRLLSGAAPPEHAGSAAGAGTSVKVLELDVADEDKGDQVVASSQLPAKVLAAFDAQFPGADLDEAEIDAEDGEPTYGLSAEFRGRNIDVTLTAEGEVVEVERGIDIDELPKAVVEWLRREFPDAQVDEASVVDAPGGVHYEVAFTSPDRQTREARLSVGEATAPDPAAAAEFWPKEVAAVSPAMKLASLFSTVAAGGSPEMVLPTEDLAVVSAADQAESRPGGLAFLAEVAGHIEAAAYLANLIAEPTTAVAEAFRAVSSATGAAEWLPQLAGILNDVLPADAGAMEQALFELLAGLDALTLDAASDVWVGQTATRLAAAALLVAAVRVLIELRSRKGQPVLLHEAANSSWSWVLGAPSSRRHP